MENKQANKVLVLVMALVLAMISLYAWFKPLDRYSNSERRLLQEFPKLTLSSIDDGKFQKEFETYTLDQFPLRDKLRALKNVTALYGFRQAEVNRLYLYDGYIGKIEYPLSQFMVDNAAKKFRTIYDTYLKDLGGKVYLSVVPDKNYLLGQRAGKLRMDYAKLVDDLTAKTTYMTYIDIFPLLRMEDYYYTDTHWRQEKLVPIAEALARAMGTEIQKDYQVENMGRPFYGVYYGQLAIPIKPDQVRYLNHKDFVHYQVTSYKTGKPLEAKLYDMDKLDSKDPYEMYLGGNDALLTIENPMAKTDKELLIFRDSFASSIGPLLATGYKKLTLVDIRYINPRLLGTYIDFKGQDVLFLYSTLVLNASTSFK